MFLLCSPEILSAITAISQVKNDIKKTSVMKRFESSLRLFPSSWLKFDVSGKVKELLVL